MLRVSPFFTINDCIIKPCFVKGQTLNGAIFLRNYLPILLENVELRIRGQKNFNETEHLFILPRQYYLKMQNLQ